MIPQTIGRTGRLFWLGGILVTVLMCVPAAPASAKIDSFHVNHVSGPCGRMDFPTNHMDWDRRGRIPIVSGERISVTLFGFGADLAEKATGANIFEWIENRGTTTNYPDRRIMFGGVVPTGFVRVDVRAATSQGLGDRTVTVKWLTGTETFSLRIVPNCNAIFGTMRHDFTGLGSGGGGGMIGSVGSNTPDLMPSLASTFVLTRSLNGQTIATPGGGMTQVNGALCSSLPANAVTSVAVPRLTWGVVGVNIQRANTSFDVQLLDVTDMNDVRTLDTLTLPQGFPANTPLVQRDNYPGRATAIRVIRNPRFDMGTGIQTFVGCFTKPGSTQTLDPRMLMIRVDPGGRIDEGSRENNNELLF